MIRTPTALIPYLFALAAVIAGLLWHAGDETSGLGRAISSGSPSVGGPFLLLDQTGKARSSADFRGRFMLIYFGFSYCPDVCPTSLSVMQAALDKLGPRAARIVPIFISVDPQRDTPRVLKDYIKAFGSRFVALTGSTQAIAQVAREYRVYYRKQASGDGSYGINHSSAIYLMGPDGRFLTYYESEIGPDGLADDLNKRL